MQWWAVVWDIVRDGIYIDGTVACCSIATIAIPSRMREMIESSNEQTRRRVTSDFDTAVDRAESAVAHNDT